MGGHALSSGVSRNVPTEGETMKGKRFNASAWSDGIMLSFRLLWAAQAGDEQAARRLRRRLKGRGR
jgi:hypothetical protein